MSKLLVNERPLVVIPSLAVKLGLNEAMVLQQIHYWLQGSQHQYDGRKWVYNSYKEWQVQLPFWSESTIKRTIKSLEKQGYVISANYNKSKLDQTKWYCIDYKKLAELEGVTLSTEEVDVAETEMNIEDVKEAEGNDTKPKEMENEEEEIPYEEVTTYLNHKIQSNYRWTTRKTRDLIAERWKEGFTLEDFKTVIDLKASEWLNDPKWSRYLRPETLFGTKFESYLNQKLVKNLICEEDFDLDDEA